MSLWQTYYLAHHLNDALQALAEAPESALIIAGGTDLLLDLQQGRHPPVHTLVDITSVPEMTAIEMRQGELFIGSAAPLNQIVRSALAAEHAQALVEAADLIGGPQVRNTATLGGNVAHALPAADGTISLLALGAEAEIADREGLRRVNLETLFLGPGRSALKPGAEILAGFYISARRAGQGSAFRRVMRPQGVALPIINMAARLERQGERIENVHIAIGPSGPIPQRLRAAEEVLRGGPYNTDQIALAIEAVLATARFRTSPYRASQEYRRSLVHSLMLETLQAAWERSFEA
ncbi:MAG TPA: FAD binding domain-containing protein [Anaerolineales bacterium]|nr:FAD binding domain-containing protein [Anaerolineales bacterium]